MFENEENLNSKMSNQNSKLKNLQNEIDHLNSQIINKLNAINTMYSDSGVINELIKSLKEIIISQREEITWKNNHIKKLEINFNDLVTKMCLNDDTKVKEVDRKKVVENCDIKIEEFTTTIEELLKKNTENQVIINKLREESNSEFWEDKISELNKMIIDLTDENAKLREDLEQSKKSYKNGDLNSQYSDFKRKIIGLEEENTKLEEKNRMLKAALLMTVDSETKNITDSPESLTEDSDVITSSENDKKPSIPEGPSAIRSSQEDIESSERKRQCPNCGASGAFILEMDDKSTIIYQDMGSKIYAKKYKCGDCRHEWK